MVHTINGEPSVLGPMLLLDREYPNFPWFFFPFEKNFEPYNILRISKRITWLGPTFCILYLLFVYYGPKYMQNRKPYDLGRPLQYWNLTLGVLSAWGALRVVSHLGLYVTKVGFRASLCIPPIVGYGFGAPGFWSAVFIYSKVCSLCFVLRTPWGVLIVLFPLHNSLWNLSTRCLSSCVRES